MDTEVNIFLIQREPTVFREGERERKARLKTIERMMMSGDERQTDRSDEDELLLDLEHKWRSNNLFALFKKPNGSDITGVSEQLGDDSSGRLGFQP